MIIIKSWTIEPLADRLEQENIKISTPEESSNAARFDRTDRLSQPSDQSLRTAFLNRHIQTAEPGPLWPPGRPHRPVGPRFRWGWVPEAWTTQRWMPAACNWS